MPTELSDIEAYAAEAGITLAELANCGCDCEPCSLCVEGVAHEVGHDCLDYQCLPCDARDALGSPDPILDHEHGFDCACHKEAP